MGHSAAPKSEGGTAINPRPKGTARENAGAPGPSPDASNETVVVSA